MRVCTACGEAYYSTGFCRRHYIQVKRYGRVLKRTRYDPNEIKTKAGVARVFLYDRNGNKKAEALVDANDVSKISKYKWSQASAGYAICWPDGSKGELLYMHHLILGHPPTGKMTDHKNQNRLDNRKSNLHFVGRGYNRMNAKQNTGKDLPAGIYHTPEGRFRVRAGRLCLGSYDTLEGAIKARKGGMPTDGRML